MLYSFLLYRRMKHLYIYTCAQSLSRVSLFVTPWTAASPGHKIFQTRILEWVAFSYSRWSSWPRAWTRASCISCKASGFFMVVPPGKPPYHTSSYPMYMGLTKRFGHLTGKPEWTFWPTQYTHTWIYIYTHTHTHHIFIIHSSISGHLCYFHVLAVVASAAMRIRVHVFFSNYGFLLINNQEWDCWVIWQLYFYFLRIHLQRGSVAKKPCANAGDVRDVGSSPGFRRACGEGNGNPLQFSCLKNPMDRGDWSASVHEVTKNWTWLKDSMHTHTCYFL